MLFTRCPECDTTFRVTDETLKKANGQVRCGRCASVFNAYAELHDPNAKTFEPEPPAPRRDGDVAAGEPPASNAVATSPTDSGADSTPLPPIQANVAATAGAAVEPAPALRGDAVDATAPDPTAASIGARSVADIVREADAAAAEAAAAENPEAAEHTASVIDAAKPTEIEPAATATSPDTTQDTPAISATEVERVLMGDAAPPLPQTEYAWLRDTEPTHAQPRSRWWSVAAALAVVALGAQLLHHFRSDIAGHATFGPWLTAVYGALGSELTPHWDVRQYAILDWVATAEPNARGVGSLKITARIQNRGPARQPYPAVQLRLKDRWEAAVGSRMFAPSEYLPREMPRGRLMSPGETARAEIELVDPGPDAYGFELDVCIEVEASLVTCGGDKVFL